MSIKIRMAALAVLVFVGVGIAIAMVQTSAPDCKAIASARVGSMLLYGCN